MTIPDHSHFDDDVDYPADAPIPLIPTVGGPRG